MLSLSNLCDEHSLHCHWHTHKLFHACVYPNGHQSSACSCRDMMRTRTLLTMFMKMDSDNYPEILYRMVIINAPGWFSNMWSSIKSFMSGDTPKKIEVCIYACTSMHVEHGACWECSLQNPYASLRAEESCLITLAMTASIPPFKVPFIPASAHVAAMAADCGQGLPAGPAAIHYS